MATINSLRVTPNLLFPSLLVLCMAACSDHQELPSAPLSSLSAASATAAEIHSSWEDSDDREVYWEAFTSVNINDKNVPRLPSTKQVLILKIGWSCEISQTSINEARQVTCTKGVDSVSASVMCDLNRPEDHVQLQFASGKRRDLLHLGCEFRAYRDWRRRKRNEYQRQLGIEIER